MKKKTTVEYTLTPNEVRDIIKNHFRNNHGITFSEIVFNVSTVYSNDYDSYGTHELTSVKCQKVEDDK